MECAMHDDGHGRRLLGNLTQMETITTYPAEHRDRSFIPA